jgi:thiamine pyrophosphokinase
MSFMKVIVVGNGHVPARHELPAAVFDGASLIIAADGGAARAAGLGVRPDLVVGDIDSLAPDALRRLESDGSTVVRVAAEKDESDLELAIRAALERGATSILILGALGGPRIEHELANVALLGLGGAAADIAIVDERCAIRLLDAGHPNAAEGAGSGTGVPRASADEHASAGRGTSLVLDGEPGDYVSLQPWGGDVAGVTTEGLRYPLRDEPLLIGPSRGLSNELTGRRGRVSLRSGRVLVIHTRRSALAADEIEPRTAGRAVTTEVG